MRGAIDDDTEFALEIWRLHRMIAGLVRNEILRAISLGLLEILTSNTRFVVAGSKSVADKECRVRVHEELVDAIASGDPDRCAEASRAHALADGGSHTGVPQHRAHDGAAAPDTAGDPWDDPR
jgi:DNA-binding FadR family transcriptional regulator